MRRLAAWLGLSLLAGCATGPSTGKVDPSTRNLITTADKTFFVVSEMVTPGKEYKSAAEYARALRKFNQCLEASTAAMKAVTDRTTLTPFEHVQLKAAVEKMSFTASLVNGNTPAVAKRMRGYDKDPAVQAALGERERVTKAFNAQAKLMWKKRYDLEGAGGGLVRKAT